MMWFLWISLLWARDPQKSPNMWIQLYEGQLLQYMEQDHKDAVGIYEALLENLSNTDPMYPELHYWLGRSLYFADRYEESKHSLLIAAKDSDMRKQAMLFLSYMDSWKQRVRTLPYTGQPWSSQGKDAHNWLISLASDAAMIQHLSWDIRVLHKTTIELTLINWDDQRIQWKQILSAGQHSISLDITEIMKAQDEQRIRNIALRTDTKEQVSLGKLHLR